MESPLRSDEDGRTVLEIYKMLVEMADRVSQRRQSANSFYLSVNTAIIGGSAFLAQLPDTRISLTVVAIAGIAISLLWIRNIRSYKELNRAKFKVISDLEKRLPTAAYSDEWKLLDPDGDGERYTPFHKVEVMVPWVFVAVHFAQALFSLPWRAITTAICGN